VGRGDRRTALLGLFFPRFLGQVEVVYNGSTELLGVFEQIWDPPLPIDPPPPPSGIGGSAWPRGRGERRIPGSYSAALPTPPISPCPVPSRWGWLGGLPSCPRTWGNFRRPGRGSPNIGFHVLFFLLRVFPDFHSRLLPAGKSLVKDRRSF
jgi:hypothetical protein